MVTALLLFFSSTVWGSTTFLLIAGIWKLRDFKTKDFNRPLFRIICIICILSILNFMAFTMLYGGSPANESKGLIGSYPYALSMFITYIVAATIKPKELEYLLYLMILDVFVGVLEYSMGVSSFWVVDRKFEILSDLLYDKRVCGLDANSSNFAFNMILGLIITYIIKPKRQVIIICILCVGLYLSFNRTFLLAALPLIIALVVSISRNNKVSKYLIISCIIILLYILYKQYSEIIINQFTRGSINSTTTILSNRDVVWHDFLDFINKHLVFGNGSSKLWIGEYHAHNSFLWVLASNGIIITTLYYYYTFRYITKRNAIPIITLLIGSITQSTIYWGLSTADIMLFILIIYNKINIDGVEPNAINGEMVKPYYTH